MSDFDAVVVCEQPDEWAVGYGNEGGGMRPSSVSLMRENRRQYCRFDQWKLNKYQTVYDIINAVCSLADVEELKRYIAESNTRPSDEDTKAHLVACKEALSVYEQGFFRRWSTPFLQTTLEACRQQNNVRYASIYEAEIRSRKA